MYFDHYVVHLSVGELIVYPQFRLALFPHGKSFIQCYFILCHINYICLFNYIIIIVLRELFFSFLCDKKFEIVFFFSFCSLTSWEKNFSVLCKNLENEYHHRNHHLNTHLLCKARILTLSTVFCLLESFKYVSQFSHFIQNLVKPVRHNPSYTIRLLLLQLSKNFYFSCFLRHNLEVFVVVFCMNESTTLHV